MPLPQVNQAIGEIFESGGPWQVEDGCTGLEYAHHADSASGTRYEGVACISLLGPLDPC
jgi:hypothetical protein